MRHFSTILLGLVLSGAAPSDDSVTAGPGYGKPFAPSKTISLSDLHRRGSELLGQQVTVRAQLARVCARKGCWIELKSETPKVPDLHISFSKYGFFVPTQALTGGPALVHGKVVMKTMSKARVDHLNGEGAKIKPAKDGTAQMLGLVADGVILAPRLN
jgi:hypothetical protein